jgi:purine nucleosidase
MRLIIDTDAGVDDAQAIMLALTHPGATIEAITTLTGNCHLDDVVENVFTTLDVMKRDVPVYRGAVRPLVRDWRSEAEAYHGKDGLGDWAARPKSSGRRAEAEHAALAIIRLANEAPGELTLVTLGPLTNVALAVSLDPTLPQKIKKLVFMGGAHTARGNTPTITAEYNIYCDPEAARMTLAAFPMSTMLSWEATLAYPIAWDEYDRMTTLDSDAARFFKGTTEIVVGKSEAKAEGRHGFLLPDPLAMMVALEPEIVTATMTKFMTVELQGEFTRGQTVVDYEGKLKRAPNVEIVTGMNQAMVNRMFEAMLA